MSFGSENGVAESDHWAFQKPKRNPPPPVEQLEWVRNPIDQFILSKIESNGILPSSEADPSTLIRRVSLDLTGLPPSPEEVRVFLNDQRPDAYERFVDGLLASPAYGERWGRHWLDLARYADSNGFTRDFARQIWKYRDWVIDAINQNLPFDRFTIEQIAGDMLPNATLEQMIATGFHRNTLINEEGGTDPEQFRVDAVADRVATTGAVFLGLTVGCARCHEHKYDPISQQEYYELFAFLNNCDEPEIDAPTELQIADGVVRRRDLIRERIRIAETKLEAQHDEFLRRQIDWETTVTPEFRATLPGPTQASLDLLPDKRDDTQKKLVAELFKTTEEARSAFPIVAEIARLRASEPVIPTTMVMQERSDPRETHVQKRGNFLDLGARVSPGVPADLHSMIETSKAPDRLDFAAWLVSPENPLTPRVIVNRYWHRFFGTGIVETENDFGTQASPPTHPALLDWLACEFVDRDWNVKAIHRLIVTSAAYRQASKHRSEVAEIDPANKLLARQNRVRLDAEIVRDCGLLVSGLLSRKLGGPSVYPPQPDGVFEFTQDPKPWITAAGEDRYRRGMYTYFWRSSPYPALMVFDAPNANVTCTRRVRSNTPLQALTLANDIQFLECAKALADWLIDQSPNDVDLRVAFTFLKCLGREPSADERRRAVELIQSQEKAFDRSPETARELLGDVGGANEATLTQRATWTFAARVVMNLDEFITRE